MKELTQKQCQSIILGSTLFSTGGGLTLKQQQLIIDRMSGRVILEDRPTVNTLALIPLEIGEANTKSITTNELVNKLLNQLGNLHIRPDFVLPAEMGQESVAFLAASIFRVPVLDMDMAGGRAAPRLPINVFTALGIKFNFSPCVVINSRMTTRVLRHKGSIIRAEKILRAEVIKNKEACFVASLVQIDRKVARMVNKEKTITKALQIGRFLRRRSRMPIKDVKRIRGTVIDVNKVLRPGFSCNVFIIKSTDGCVFKIFNENENLVLVQDNNVVAEAPTLITVFDSQQNKGLHCSEIKTGLDVEILLMEPLAIWETPRGKLLWKKFATTKEMRDV